MVACGQHVEFSTVIGFLDRNYRYKSVVTQIPHDVGWNLSHSPAEYSSHTGDQTIAHLVDHVHTVAVEIYMR
jgi:hypothetical protein